MGRARFLSVGIALAFLLTSTPVLGASRVFAWGSNDSGVTTVPSELTNIVAIAAGSDFALALRVDGTVISWGNHWNGHSRVPMTPPIDLTNVVAISAGYDFAGERWRR